MRKLTEQHKKKISLSKMGAKNPMFGKGYLRLGSKNPAWKGDNLTYMGIHSRIRRIFGKPKRCEICGTKTSKRYEWANISRKYKLNREDWKRMCESCHFKFDNKGEKFTSIGRNRTIEEKKRISDGLRFFYSTHHGIVRKLSHRKERKCEKVECNRKHLAKGLCQFHYQINYRNHQSFLFTKLGGAINQFSGGLMSSAIRQNNA